MYEASPGQPVTPKCRVRHVCGNRPEESCNEDVVSKPHRVEQIFERGEAQRDGHGVDHRVDRLVQVAETTCRLYGCYGFRDLLDESNGDAEYRQPKYRDLIRILKNVRTDIQPESCYLVEEDGGRDARNAANEPHLYEVADGLGLDTIIASKNPKPDGRSEQNSSNRIDKFKHAGIGRPLGTGLNQLIDVSGWRPCSNFSCDSLLPGCATVHGARKCYLRCYRSQVRSEQLTVHYYTLITATKRAGWPL